MSSTSVGEDIVAQTIRPCVIRVNFDVPQEIVEYAAGLFDADGEIQINEVSISQAQKGVACLHHVYEHFGGRVAALPLLDPVNHQQAYELKWFGESSRDFIRKISVHLLLKKREAVAFLEYWDLPRRSILDRTDIDRKLKAFKHSPHDEIPTSIMPSDAYFGGFSDGEICFDCTGKSSQHHVINQAHRPICDLFQRRFGGKVNFVSNKIFTWTIYTFADRFIESIYPYVVGKKAQIDLIKNMKPGESMDVHCKLRELKGNIGFATPKIDKHLAGQGHVFVNPPKELPKGVHVCYDGPKTMYTALLKHEKKQYNLGSFETVEKAREQYERYKTLVEEEKRGGPKVDLTFNTRSNRSNAPPKDVVLPKNIALTAANTFQVRRWINKKTVDVGTYKTLEEAIAAQKDSFETNVEQGPKFPEGVYLSEKTGLFGVRWKSRDASGKVKDNKVRGFFASLSLAISAKEKFMAKNL